MRVANGNATCHSKNTGPTDNRQLPILVENRVSPQDAYSAALVLALHEHNIHAHLDSRIVQVRKTNGPLASSHDFRIVLGPRGQQIVDHVDLAECCGGSGSDPALGYLPDGGVAADENVLEIETEPCPNLFCLVQVLEPLVDGFGTSNFLIINWHDYDCVICMGSSNGYGQY